MDKALSDRLLAVGRANATRLAGLDPFDEAEARPVQRKVKKH
jgi:hypothetical protein